MKASSVVFALGGMVFGLFVGWIVGDQQARQAQQTVAAATAVTAEPAAPLTVQANWPPLSLSGVRASVQAWLVAPGIGVPFNAHW